MVATLILPGLNGSAEGHWQRHWARDNASSTILRQASWSRPVLDEWLQALEDELERVGDVWLVGHSLGCLLAAHIGTRPAARHVKAPSLLRLVIWRGLSDCIPALSISARCRQLFFLSGPW